jgi:hypothetical protein
MPWMMKGDPVPSSPPNDEHIMAREALLRLKVEFDAAWPRHLVKSLSPAEKAELLQALSDESK